MKESHPHTPSYSFLLRLWQATDEHGEIVWRASLQRPDDRQRLGFPDIETLFAFLSAQCENAAPDNKTDDENQP